MTGSSKPRKTNRTTRKEPLAKELLLPLPVADARAISLENHLALVAMRGGHGNADVMSCLLKSVYLACFLHETVHAVRAPTSC